MLTLIRSIYWWRIAGVALVVLVGASFWCLVLRFIAWMWR